MLIPEIAVRRVREQRERRGRHSVGIVSILEGCRECARTRFRDPRGSRRSIDSGETIERVNGEIQPYDQAT